MKFKLLRISAANKNAFEAEISQLETSITYPLGQDTFTIDHGSSYFTFFERLGEMHYYAMLETTHQRIAALACGVLRTVPLVQGQGNSRAWYLCDLKVHPEFRGMHLPLKMLTRAFPKYYLRCPRGYAISMNSPGQRKNRIQALLRRFWIAPSSSPTQLFVYSLDYLSMIKCLPILQNGKGEVQFASLSGVKDLIIGSTQKKLPLLHAQFGKSDQVTLRSPVEDHTHMFCLPETNPLNSILGRQGIFPSASATIIQHGMKNSDWNFVLTSDI